MTPPAWLLALAVSGGAEVLVTPGSVARWSAAAGESCGIGARRWPPLGGVCWYPVDLLAQPGSAVTVVREGVAGLQTAALRVGPYPYPEEHLRVPERQVHLSKRDLARVAREEARVAPLWAREGEARFTLPLGSPLASRPAGGRFGSRRFFNDEARAPHGGADYRVASGTAILAVAPGTVVLAEEQFFSGKSVYVDHGGGLITMYFHLSTVVVRPGQEVTADTLLGRVGATGRATGPHLHFGVRWHGARVDPERLLAPPDAAPEVEAPSPAP